MGVVKEEKYKQIRLKFGTWAELEKLKKKNQSFDGLLMELLEEIWKRQDRESNKERENEQSQTDQHDPGSPAVSGEPSTNWGF